MSQCAHHTPVKNFLSRKLRLAALVLPLAVVSACGVLSHPERKETPSRLMLEAQAAYDAGQFDKAVELLEKLVEKDPSNEEGRVRLTFAYNGKLGILPTELIKTFSSESGSSGASGGSSDVSKLTGSSGLSETQNSKLKAQYTSSLTVAELRRTFDEFATFHKAFLAICPLFSKTTLDTLRVEAASALSILELDKCGPGQATANPTVSIAALSLALAKFSSLYKAIFDSNNDGVFDIQKKAEDASSKLSAQAQNKDSVQDAATASAQLALLNEQTKVLTEVAADFKSELFKLAIAQFKVISAVILGVNLPDSVKGGIEKGVQGLNAAVGKIDEYLDAGKSTGTTAQGGQAAQDAATKAADAADSYLKNLKTNNATEFNTQLPTTCKNFCDLRSAYGLPDTTQPPAECLPQYPCQ